MLDEEHRFEPLEFCGRVSAVTNNFWMWWKEGWYRELHEDETMPISDFPDRTTYNRFLTDLDAASREGGYEDAGTLVLNNDSASLGQELWNKRMHIIADVYLRMREKGYENGVLRT